MEYQTLEKSPGSLLADAMKGEWAAWDEIIARYERLVLHAAARMGLSRSDAADVAQQTWIRLWQYAGQIRESDRLAAWLVSTARREALRMAGASRRYVPCADPSAERDLTDVADLRDAYPSDREYNGIVEQALGRLPGSYGRLLRLLSSDQELSYSEISERMGVPMGSIGPMRMRAIRMLKNTPEFASREFPRPALAGARS